jgi:DNA-binding Lrp family transcriptional regulator
MPDSQTSNPTREQPGPAGRSAALDDVDRAMVRELLRDGRASVRTLAERLSLSRSSAYSRLNRLLDDGVITGFTATVSPLRAGLGTSAFVGISIEQNTWRTLAPQLAALPHVEHVALVSGDVDALVLVRAPDNTALRDAVLGRIQSLPGVRSTHTWLIFEESERNPPEL